MVHITSQSTSYGIQTRLESRPSRHRGGRDHPHRTRSHEAAADVSDKERDGKSRLKAASLAARLLVGGNKAIDYPIRVLGIR